MLTPGSGGVLVNALLITQEGSIARLDNSQARVRVAAAADWTGYAAGESFDVPGDASFEIAVAEGICEYVCSFL